MQVLEMVNRNMAKMKPEELKAFRLYDTLGGRSNFIHKRAIKRFLIILMNICPKFIFKDFCWGTLVVCCRVYGDKADDIIHGCQKNPAVAVPLVLNRYLLTMFWQENRQSSMQNGRSS